MTATTSIGSHDTDRVTPPCPHFGPCGGCQLQELTYAAQLELKSDRLHQLLDVAQLNLPELELHPSPPFAYRNRIRLTLGEVDGQLRAGYMTASSQQSIACFPQPIFLPITQCPIAAPILWQAAEAFLNYADASSALRHPQIKLDQLELFTSADESALQFTLSVRTKMHSLPTQIAAAFNALCESIRNAIPQLTGASIAILPPATSNRSRRNEDPRPGPSWGASGLLYSVQALATDKAQPVTCWVPRGAFFQVNRFLIPTLVSLVTSDRGGTLAFDLYAGVGLFSRALAQSFERVVAVEAAGPAATALGATKLVNLQAVKDTSLDFLRRAVVDRDRPDLVVVDPPRTGAGSEVCTLLARLAAPTLVYVSCSPETLPGDLTILAAAGYTASALHLLDLFPQTNHIETVAILSRAKD